MPVPIGLPRDIEVLAVRRDGNVAGRDRLGHRDAGRGRPEAEAGPGGQGSRAGIAREAEQLAFREHVYGKSVRRDDDTEGRERPRRRAHAAIKADPLDTTRGTVELLEPSGGGISGDHRQSVTDPGRARDVQSPAVRADRDVRTIVGNATPCGAAETRQRTGGRVDPEGVEGVAATPAGEEDVTAVWTHRHGVGPIYVHRRAANSRRVEPEAPEPAAGRGK
jgi:hypothetical protein